MQVLIIFIETFVFSSTIRKLIGKKTTFVIYIFTFVFAFFIALRIIYTIEDFEMMMNMLTINKGVNLTMNVIFVFDFIMEYIPRIIQAIAMWVLYYGNIDTDETVMQIDDVINETLIN